MWTVEVCALWGGCEEGVLENRLDEGSVLKVKVKDKGKSGGGITLEVGPLPLSGRAGRLAWVEGWWGR